MDLKNILGGKTNQELLNDLVNPNNIYLKTIIKKPQLRSIIQMKWMIELRNPDNKDKTSMQILSDILDWYFGLLISIDGQSRKDIIDGIIGSGLQNIPQSNPEVK